jgi:hypothetical protein
MIVATSTMFAIDDQDTQLLRLSVHPGSIGQDPECFLRGAFAGDKSLGAKQPKRSPARSRFGSAGAPLTRRKGASDGFRAPGEWRDVDRVLPRTAVP